MMAITTERLAEIEERVNHIAAFVGFPHGLKKDVLDLIAALRSLPAVNREIGEMRENGVVWYGGNPHSFPEGTVFYAAPKGEA